MATKKAAAKAAEAKATETKEPKKGKKVLTEEEKKAKRAALKERLKNRPEGQRPQSKQFDVIDLGNGQVAKTYGMNVKKFGVVSTTVVTDKDGNVISVSNATIPGVSVKVKKGHGNLIAKLPGVKKGEVMTEEETTEDEE